MTSDADILSHPFTSSSVSPSSIIVGNGSFSPVTSTSATNLSPKLRLNNVLVSPNLIKNLISVRQFTSDNNCSVEFDPLGCSVKDLPSRREIIRCDSSGPLYPLRLPTSSSLATATPSLWHQRLGHPGHEVLSTLACLSAIPCNKGAGDSTCHACLLLSVSNHHLTSCHFR